MFLLSILLLAVCAVASVENSAASDSDWPLGRVPQQFGADYRDEENFSKMPLDYSSWLSRKTDAKVPMFEKGTHIADVVSEAQEWGLKPNIDDDIVIVLEGASRHNFDNSSHQKLAYIFNESKLELGPVNAFECVGNMVIDGLSSRELNVLEILQTHLPFGSREFNGIAWSLATNADPRQQNGALAVSYAQRANELSKWRRMAHLDTLGAAFARQGDFKRAVVFQRYALQVSTDESDGVAKRLTMFENKQAYEAAPDDSANFAFPMLPALQKRALSGDAAAQLEMANFLLDNGIGIYGGQDDAFEYWVQEAASNGSTAAVATIGEGQLMGRFGFERDIGAASRMLQLAAENGDSGAHYNLARIHRDAIGVSYDDKRAAEFLLLAAEGGHAGAALELSFRFREGAGVERDLAKSERYYRIAMEADFSLYDYLLDHTYLYEAFLYPLDAKPPVMTWEQAQEFPQHLMRLVRHINAEVDAGQSYITATIGETVWGWPIDHAPEVTLGLAGVAATLGLQDAQRYLADAYSARLGDMNAADAKLSEERSKYWHARSRGQFL